MSRKAKAILTAGLVLLNAIGIVSVVRHASAEEPSEIRAIVVQEGEYKFRVKLDPTTREVDVFSMGKKTPSEMSISLFHDSTTGDTVDLKALSLEPESPKFPKSPKFQGKVDCQHESHVAVELRFPISGGKSWKHLRKAIK